MTFLVNEIPMNKISYIAAIALPMILFSCAKVNEQPAVDEMNQEEEVLIPLSFTATSAETKTELADNGVSINWLNTDQISVFDGSANRQFSVDGLGDGEKATTVTFTGSAADVANYYALYPYNSSSSLVGTTINTTLADEQNAVEGSFGNGFNINAAKSTDKTTFSFTNVLSVVKFTVDNTKLDGKTIKKVELFFTKPAAGDVSISVSSSITASAGATTVNHVSMEDAGGLADGDYYFTILPQVAGKIRFQITSTDGFVARKEAVVSSDFVAGNIKPIGTIKNLTWTKVYFYDGFDSYSEPGGNDDDWNHSGTSAILTAPDGWSTFTKVYPASACIRMATGSASGIATTAALTNIPSTETNVKLAFKAGLWVAKTEDLTVTASTGGSHSSFGLSASSWKQIKDLAFNSATESTTITFTTGSSNNQTFLDEVLVYVGDCDLAYEIARNEVSDDLPVPTFGASINSSATLPAAGTTRTVTVTGNVMWTASATCDGTPSNSILSTTSGSGAGSITVTIPANESKSATPRYVITVSTSESVATQVYNFTLDQLAKADATTLVDETFDNGYSDIDSKLTLTNQTGTQTGWARLGSSSKKGKISCAIPSGDASGKTLTVSFDANGWSDTENTLTITVTNGTASESSVTLTSIKGGTSSSPSWNSICDKVSFTVSPETGKNVTINVEGSKRFLLDNFKVVAE